MILPDRRTRILATAFVLFIGAVALVMAAWNTAFPFKVPDAPAAHVSWERLQNIPIYDPGADARGLAILVSDTGGMDDRDRAFLRRLLSEGLRVLPINLETWRAEMIKGDGCIYLGSDLEGIAKEAQRVLNSERYFHPVLTGIGEGGTLAYAALADAPAATFSGAVAIEPTATLNIPLPVCEGAKATPAGKGFAYATDAQLPDPAVIVSGNRPLRQMASPEPDHHVASFKSAATEYDRTLLGMDAVLRIAARDAASTALPIVDIPAVGAPQFLALFYSGDGGWRDIDKELGDTIAASNIHVIGVDSLRYFWSERQPEEIARDFSQIVRDADPSGKLPVALLGYSFGANTLPFAWPYLPKDLQDRIRFIGLLGTESTTPFQVSVGNWLGMGGDKEVAPAIAAMPADRILCVHGEDEDETACTDPLLSGVETLKLEGGHHFNGDYKSLAARLVAEMKKRLPQAPAS